MIMKKQITLIALFLLTLSNFTYAGNEEPSWVSSFQKGAGVVPFFTAAVTGLSLTEAVWSAVKSRSNNELKAPAISYGVSTSLTIAAVTTASSVPYAAVPITLTWLGTAATLVGVGFLDSSYHQNKSDLYGLWATGIAATVTHAVSSTMLTFGIIAAQMQQHTVPEGVSAP